MLINRKCDVVGDDNSSVPLAQVIYFQKRGHHSSRPTATRFPIERQSNPNEHTTRRSVPIAVDRNAVREGTQIR